MQRWGVSERQDSPASEASERPRPPWYAVRDVTVLIYRINRRPLPLTLFSPDEPNPPFPDHLAECLLFGPAVTTAGGGHERHWRLGNRTIDRADRYLAGWVGYITEDAEEQNNYDNDTAEWKTEIVQSERRVTAPFVIVAESRFLYVVKHPTFSEGAVRVVFEALLNLGEREREVRTTEWAVEPVLDTADFGRWLEETAVLDSVSFHVRLPNHDADDNFKQLADHLKIMKAESFDHRLKARDPESGLSKNFEDDAISQGLMQMARRAFATVRAKGRAINGKPRSYDQRERVRKARLPRLPADQDQARDRLVQRALEQGEEEQSDG